ncbi:Gfo/Idh/MocA family oxidoreductase [Thalassobacillus sp. C254]|uniref:Gfo/Idh/MocA family oxidoreductase n=1 Tax=Thalassobacillus sp. C254 TaxID=1225341 RepID=UPI0006D07FF9|nr:Gfo/Idh/MocA family oxidoreductase [Thalassobacillus sp. C254]
MTNTRIAVIGMGQIGRRHLQALTRIDRPIHIQVVDPSPSALQQARKAYHDMKPPRYPQHVEYFSRLDSLSPHLHLAIIATTAEVRKATVEQLLRLKNVHRLILEKVVFQYPDDFVNINKVLQEKNVKTWVNCPLRIYPFFSGTKKKYKMPNKGTSSY